MKISNKLLEAIVESVSADISLDKKEGEIKGYEPMRYFIDVKPKNTLFSFPLSTILNGISGTVYIGGEKK